MSLVKAGHEIEGEVWVYKKKMRERVEILCSTQWPTLLSLVFDLGDFGDLTS